ncbi:hypothetical protein Tco_1308741, partial [Tanacetum coccineum]
MVRHLEKVVVGILDVFVCVLVDLLEGKYAIGTKWILKNKRDARGIV